MPAADLSVPMVVMDYAFLRDKGEERTITSIVAGDRQTRVTTAAQVPMKQAFGEVVHQCVLQVH